MSAELKLRPHQVKAVGEMSDGCILRGGVGSGKSLTSVIYYQKNHHPRDIFVITTAKKRDSLEWDRDFARIAISRKGELSHGGAKLVVDSWNSIDKYADVEDAFFIFDEQRLVGKGAWVKAFYKIAAKNKWILLSATPGDTWMEFVPVFVANGYYKNRSQFVTRHVVYNRHSKFPKVDRYLETDVLARIKSQVLVEMPYVMHTTRHPEIVEVSHNEELFQKVWKERWHVYEDRPLKDIGEMFLVSRKVVSSDDSRLQEVIKLSAIHPRLIIFYNHNHELENLRKLTTLTDRPVAEWNGQKHQEIPDSEKWFYLVQYTAGAEGWNCTTTDSIIFYSLTYSYKIYEQAMGRIDRMDTPYNDLYYYIFKSNTPIDTAVWKALQNKKNFNLKKMKVDFPTPEEDVVSKKAISSTEDVWPEGSVEELIHRRRRQVLVHSMIYYHMNESIISDTLFDEWSKELAELQRANPKASGRVIFQKRAFRDFDGSSGYHLPIDDVRINNTARRLVEQHKKREKR